jgi:hypothetical protein
MPPGRGVALVGPDGPRPWRWYGWNPLEREDTGVFRLLEDIPPARVGDVWLDGPGCNETKGAWNRLRV